jgi:protein required for attachment to host cells
MDYDPDQDADEKRDVRKKYRSLYKDIEEKQTNFKDTSAQDLAQKVQDADDLFDKGASLPSSAKQ